MLRKVLGITEDEVKLLLGNPCYYSIKIKKKSGGFRYLNPPIKRLKEIQQRILYKLLYRIKPHENAYGFIKNRCPKDMASKQLNNVFFLSMDFKDYFQTIKYDRIIAAFYFVLSYINKKSKKLISDNIKKDARILANLCSFKNTLPQGAPTSPALANIITYQLDKDLTDLARTNDLTYTRYADDITFGSLKLDFNFDNFKPQAATFITLNGFIINNKKTRFMRPHKRQQITGVVVNDKLGVSKGYYKNTKAGVHNLTTGRAHLSKQQKMKLRGRIEWIRALDANKGDKLLKEFLNA